MLRLSPLVLVFALPVVAADVALKPVYLQTVPQSQVLVDRRGKAWFVDESGVRDANNKLACDATDGQLLLVDKAGRFWFNGAPKGKRNQLRYHDGTGWTDTGVESYEVHEDAAGRVIARTAPGFQVLDGGKWTGSKWFHPQMQAYGRYIDDPAGRVWCVLDRSDGGSGIDLWAFDGKKWNDYDPLKREQDERYAEVIPFDDDWFLVSTFSTKVIPPAPRRWAVWSPTRTTEQIAKEDKLSALPQLGLTFFGTDVDGLRHFTRTSVNDGKRWLDEASFVVSADGTVKMIPAADAARMKAQPRTGWTGQPRIFASITDPAPAIQQADPASAAGRDSDGRVYFPTFTRNRMGTVVLWAKHETPTACLRPTTHTVGKWEKASVSGLFADPDGTAFALQPRPDIVLTWDGKTEAWADTPIKPLPISQWGHHVDPPPAEHVWANVRAVGHTIGSDGLTLFARVKTKYVPEKDGAPPPGLPATRGGRFPGGRAEVAEEKPKEPDGPFYHYEVWLHAGGKWSDPQPPADLIPRKQKDLLAVFTQSATPFGPLPVIAHAGRVWFIHDWKVSAVDADGVIQSAALTVPAVRKPANEWDKQPPRPLMLAALARKDDKTLVAVVAASGVHTEPKPQASAYEITFQAGKLGGVKVSELPALPVGLPTLHTTPDGTVLAWGNRHDGVFALTGDKWEKVAGAGRVLARTPDGAVWCEPANLWEDADWKKGNTVLVRVGGAKAERFVWTPDEWVVGFDKPPAGSAVVLLAHLGIGCLEPGKPGAKPALRVRYTPWLRSSDHPAELVVTASGHLLLTQEWVRLFVPKAK